MSLQTVLEPTHSGSWIRSAYGQIILLSFICFACPGMFNALNSLSPPGLNNETLKNNANTALYTCFAVFGLFAGGFNNLIGPRLLLMVGGATYALFAGSYLSIAKYGDDAAVFAIAAAAALGIGAGLLWAAQGAMIMSYPTENKKGTYFGVFWSIFNLGAVMGSAAATAINWESDAHQGPSDTTYYAFLSIMLAGCVLALFIVPPCSILKENGDCVCIDKVPNLFEETKAILKSFLHPHMILMLIPAATSNWFYTYQFGPFQSVFTTRTQALNSTFYWLFQMAGSWLMGCFVLDYPQSDRVHRAYVGWCVLVLSTFVIWGSGFAWELQYRPLVMDKVDVRDTLAWLPSFILYIFYGFYDAIFQTYSYWLMGALTNDANTLSRYAGFYKGIQSCFAAVSWQLGNIIDPTSSSLVWFIITVAPCLVSCVLFKVIIKLHVHSTSE